jgi:O-antigen/teichoic acid export membrane protein
MHVDVVDPPEANPVQMHGRPRTICARVWGLWKQFPAASKGVLALVDQTLVSGTSFATAVIVNRNSSSDQVGLYYLTASIVLIALGTHEHVIAAPYTILSKRHQGRELSLYGGSVWLHHAILTALSIVALLVSIVALSWIGPADMVPGLWALVGAGPMLLLREWIRRFTFADLRIVPAIALDFTVASLQIGALLLLAYFDRLTLFAIYAAMGGACAAACVLWYFSNRPSLHVDRARVLPDWKRNWSFGKWALRSYFVGNTTPYIMPWIVNAAAGTAAAGTLGACITLVGLTNLLLLSVDRVLTPRAAQAFVAGGPALLKRVLGLAAGFMVAVLGVFCLAVFLTGDWIAVFAYGSKFVGSGPILAVLALHTLMVSLQMVAGIGLWAIEQPRANFLADVCSLAATLGMAAVLVGPLGVLGAALGILAGSTTAVVIRSATLFRALDGCVLEPQPN